VFDSLRGAMSMYGNGFRMSYACRSNIDAGDLTGAVSGSRSTSAAVMDSKYRPNVADQSRTSGTSRTEQSDVSCSGTDRRETIKDDIVATKEVEVFTLHSVPVANPAVYEYIRLCEVNIISPRRTDARLYYQSARTDTKLYCQSGKKL